MGQQILLTLRSLFRDRILQAVFFVGALLLLIIPIFSMFSMRQVPQTAVSLSLSATSLILLILTVQIGATSIYRDVDRRYTTAVLSLPVSRARYLVGRYLGLVIFICLSVLVLALFSTLIIYILSNKYPSSSPLLWSNIVLAFASDACKYILLAAVAVFFSTFSTSFALPFFSTFAVYLAGSASQEVFEFITGSLGTELSAAWRIGAKIVYYLLPNFSSFDLHIQAIYGLTVNLGQVASTFLYGILYSAVLIFVATWAFGRRELP